MTNNVAEAYRRFGEMATLESDWDSYGALPITERALNTAKELMEEMLPIEPFFVGPIANGGVMFEYRGVSKMEIDIGPDGTYGYLYLPSDDPATWLEEDNVSRQTVIDAINYAADGS